MYVYIVCPTLKYLQWQLSSTLVYERSNRFIDQLQNQNERKLEVDDRFVVTGWKTE